MSPEPEVRQYPFASRPIRGPLAGVFPRPQVAPHRLVAHSLLPAHLPQPPAEPHVEVCERARRVGPTRNRLFLPRPSEGEDRAGGTARRRSALASRHERGSSPPKLVRMEALSFFSQEEVARARAYHRPLYWAAAADVAIEASVLAALAWSGAGTVLDPGSLPWWGRTPAYAAIVVAASAAVRAPLALWSGFIRERRWGFSTERMPSWAADRAKAVGVNIVLTAAALLGLVALARALPG